MWALDVLCRYSMPKNHLFVYHASLRIIHKRVDLRQGSNRSLSGYRLTAKGSVSALKVPDSATWEIPMSSTW